MNSKKQTVLVADDDPRLLKLIQRNLEMSNYRVVTVSDGPSVLRQAESEDELDRGMVAALVSRARRLILAF